MADKPTAAMVLSLIGGIFVLIGGAVIATVGSIFSSFAVPGTEGVSTAVTALGAVGAVLGLVMIIGAVMMYSKPQTHTMWGVIVLILSIVSWVTSAGGFVIGFILGLIGGILALVYKPAAMPAVSGTMPTSSTTS